MERNTINEKYFFLMNKIIEMSSISKSTYLYVYYLIITVRSTDKYR